MSQQIDDFLHDAEDAWDASTDFSGEPAMICLYAPASGTFRAKTVGDKDFSREEFVKWLCEISELAKMTAESLLEPEKEGQPLW